MSTYTQKWRHSTHKSLHTNFSNIQPSKNLALKTCIVAFLDKHRIISSSQYGFQEGKSAQEAIIHLTSTIQEALNDTKCNKTLCVFLDLAKAFDTVDHEQLLKTLENIGVRGNENKLTRSYLTNRPQYVKIGNTLSEERTVKCGVPQGTVLGPVLFTIYISMIYSVSQRKERSLTFSDDTSAIFYKDDTWETLKK